MKNELRKISLLGVDMTVNEKADILKYIDELLEKEDSKGYIVTPNPEIVVLAQKDSDFRQILNHAQVSLVDGIGLLLAGKVLHKGLSQRISGTDFMLELCSRYAEKPVKLGFLGGRQGVAEKAVKCLLEKHPRLTISFISDEWSRQGFANARLFFKKQDEKSGQNTPSRETSEKEEIDILFVAFGFPKQEYFMAEKLPNIPVKLAMGVGGAFDYLSGNVARAPRLLQTLGLEWLFRLIRQPWRIRRQFALLRFVLLVIQERFQSSGK